MLEQKLQEELNRYKAINKYGKTMIMEQDAPPADAPTDVPPPPGDAPTDLPPAPDAAGTPTDVPPPPVDAPAEPAMDDNTEEVDVTDLVDMTKSIKKDIEDNKAEHSNVLGKMDDVFTKLGDLEQKLADMDSVMAKIDELGAKIEANKPKTEVEKLEMRSLDSYPFNEKPQEFFAHKQGEMKASGKNEYVLTKDDVENYPTDQIKQSFNPEEEKDEYSY
jgi:hypothetical protein